MRMHNFLFLLFNIDVVYVCHSTCRSEVIRAPLRLI